MGYNIAEEKMSRHQEGGTAMVVQGRLSQMVMETGQDRKKLGQWCWVKVGTPEHSTYIVTVYMPCDNVNTDSARERVFDQHRKVLEAGGDAQTKQSISGALSATGLTIE